MLDHGRLRAGQVAKGPVADPGILQPHAGWLHTAKLAAGLLNVALVVPGRGRDGMGIAYVPSSCSQGHPFLVIWSDVERQLQRPGRVARQLQEWSKARPLVVQVRRLSCPATREPVSDSREWGLSHRHMRRPPIQRDTRRRVLPLQPQVRKRRTWLAHRLTDAEVDVVRREAHLPFAHPNLEQSRIDVQQGRPSEALHHPRRHLVTEIEEEIGVGGQLEVQAAHRGLRRQRLLGLGTKR